MFNMKYKVNKFTCRLVRFIKMLPISTMAHDFRYLSKLELEVINFHYKNNKLSNIFPTDYLQGSTAYSSLFEKGYIYKINGI